MAIHQEVTAAAAADTATLALAPADAAVARGSLWSFLFRDELSLEGLTPEEVLVKAGDHQGLLRRHGRRRVLEFYEHRLLPALSRFSASVELWRTRFEVGCRTVALRAAHQPSARVVKLARWLADELPRARFSSDPKEDFATRRQVRAFLAGQLAQAGASLEALGQESAALDAYELAQRLEPMNPKLREKLAPLLWRIGDRSPRAVATYVRHLRDCGQNGAHPAMRAFVDEKIRIAEDSHPDELPQRIQWNQLALLGAEPLTGASHRTGLGYLGLDQPERSIPYLSHARSGDGAGAERASAFFHLGRALYLNGAFAEAMTAFEQAEEAGYEVSRIVGWRALALAKNGQGKAALELFKDAEQSLGEEGVTAEFYLQWGRTSFLGGDPEEAAQRFQQALDRDPEDRRALHALAICLDRQDCRRQAIELLERTIGENETFAPVLHRFGRLLEDDGRRNDALCWYRQAVERSPNDPHYALALGLVLDDQGSAEALPYLAQAAEAEVGGPEVLRRLAMGHRRNGNRRLYRHWLKVWASGRSVSQEVARFYARELASQATEAFNAGRYAEAATLARRVAPELPNDPRVQVWLGTALLFDAVSRLGNGSGDGVWNQIDEVHQLCATPESRFYHGVSQLIRGEVGGAVGQLRAMAEEFPERQENRLFAELAAAFSGDERAAESLASLEAETEASQLARLVFILQVYQALSKKDFARAAELIKAWLQDSGRARELDLPRHQINILAAVCLVRGTRSRRQRLVHLFEKLNTEEDGFWDLSLLLVRQMLMTASGAARAAEVEPQRITELDAGYRRLLAEAPSPEEQPAIRQAYAGLLRFNVAHQIGRQNVVASRETLAELRNLALPMPPAVDHLEKALEQRMAKPSHQKAFALLATDPDAAQEFWNMLAEQNPNDLLALHHLACLAWSRAYDKFAAGNYQGAGSFWKEGLKRYGRLYSLEAYWEEQRQKGHKLASAGHGFDEGAFTAWRRDALYQHAYSVLEMIFHLLAGTDPTADNAESATPVFQAAQTLMKILRESYLEAEVEQRLSDALAKHYLDPDPTNLTDYGAAVRRARWIIDIDPENVSARCFLIRAATHRVSTQRELGKGDAAEHVACLEEQAVHADWLRQALPAMRDDRRTRVTSDLVAYHDQMGMIKHEEGQEETVRHNADNGFTPSEVQMFLERIRQCYRDSDAAFSKSLDLQDFNPTAKGIMEHHKQQYESIQSNLRQLHIHA